MSQYLIAQSSTPKNDRHPHHTPILVVIGVAIGLALVATAVVLAGYFTNWFRGASESGGYSKGDSDSGGGGVEVSIPTSFDLEATNTFTNVSGTYTQTDIPSGGASISARTINSSSTNIEAKYILAAWDMTASNNIKLTAILAYNNGYVDDSSAYYWAILNSSGNVSYYATSDSVDISSVSGEWNAVSVNARNPTETFTFTSVV
jgi:hypothetical protein